MNAQRAKDKAQRRRAEASWTLLEARTVCPRGARRDRQLARAASHRAGRQAARAEERMALDEAEDLALPSQDCMVGCRACDPLPDWRDVQAMPDGCRYIGSIEPFACS